jgi:hypothetical protein
MSLADLSRVFGTGLYWYSGQVQSGGEVLGLLKIGASLRETTPPAKLAAIHASSRPPIPHTGPYAFKVATKTTSARFRYQKRR